MLGMELHGSRKSGRPRRRHIGWGVRLVILNTHILYTCTWRFVDPNLFCVIPKVCFSENEIGFDIPKVRYRIIRNRIRFVSPKIK